MITMAWWELKTNVELTDADREHIAKMIIEGYVQGQVVHEDESGE